jgi:hypothetical protein
MPGHSIRLRFSAADNWTLRTSATPAGGAGAALPPPMRTLAGAARTLLHTLTGIGPSHKRGGTALNSLCLRGPYLTVDFARTGQYQRLYPWPAHLLVPLDGAAQHDCWLAEADFIRWQAQPALDRAAPANCLRGDGYLYRRAISDHASGQASYLHLAQSLAFEVEVFAPWSPSQADRHGDTCAALAQLRAHLQAASGAVRLGARGPLVQVHLVQADQAHQPLAQAGMAAPLGERVLILFATHADFAGDWKPRNFRLQQDASGHSKWQGFADAAHGVELAIMQTACHPNIMEAGWDSSTDQPRSPRALLPAGSVWFCQVLRGQAAALQGAQLGTGRELGRGEIALTNWA